MEEMQQAHTHVKEAWPLAVGAASIVILIALLSRTNLLRRIVLMSLRYTGECPKHVAIIMDGNRRWAKARGLSPQAGHEQGEQTLINTLKWCKEAGISTITVYTFSIENFKRPKEEVDAIMSIVKRSVEKLLQPGSTVHKEKIRVRFWGNMDIMPEDLRKPLAELSLATEGYTGSVCNLCLAYTSRWEIAQAVAGFRNAVSERLFTCDDLSEQLFEQFLESGTARGGSLEDSLPDVLIRTSGEVRLSDFLVWQSAFSHLAFIRVKWPEFSAMHYSRVVISYRRALRDIRYRMAAYQSVVNQYDPIPPSKYSNSFATLEHQHRSYLQQCAAQS